MGYYARRQDSNAGQVIEALNAAGWITLDTSRAGFGAPDLIAVRNGVVRLVELKDGRKKPSARKLTPLEAEVHAAFAAAGVPIVVISSVDEALALR